jgi:hypothetical protein
MISTRKRWRRSPARGARAPAARRARLAADGPENLTDGLSLSLAQRALI